MSGIYQHFRKEEKEFIDLVLKWRDDVEAMYAPKLTDFLDPRQQFIVSSIVGTDGEVLVRFDGGEETERKRALLYPSYYEPSREDFELTLFEIKAPVKFVTLEHKHVLGSVMGLGVKREKFGDIFLNGDRVQLVSTKELAPFLQMNLQQIGKATVKTEETDWENQIRSAEEWKDKFVMLSSLRLDVVTAGTLGISRQKSQLLIQAGRVKVNFKVEEQTSFECAEEDMISVRGFGRFRIGEIEGRTKKDKLRLNVYILGG